MTFLGKIHRNPSEFIQKAETPELWWISVGFSKECHQNSHGFSKFPTQCTVHLLKKSPIKSARHRQKLAKQGVFVSYCQLWCRECTCKGNWHGCQMAAYPLRISLVSSSVCWVCSNSCDPSNPLEPPKLQNAIGAENITYIKNQDRARVHNYNFLFSTPPCVFSDVKPATARNFRVCLFILRSWWQKSIFYGQNYYGRLPRP